MAVASPSYYADTFFSNLQVPSGPSNFLGLTDGGSVAVPSVSMTSQSLFNGGDNVAAWNFLPSFPNDCYNLPNLQSVFEPLQAPPAEEDYLSLNEADFMQQINGCTPVMHPNLVSTLKCMVSPSDASHPTFPFHVFDNQSELTNVNLGYCNFVESHVQPSLSSGRDSVQAFSGESSVEQALVPSSTKVKQEVEKVESDENIEAAVVPVDLIQNRRPFRCQYDGCNKTFKNPQTMKMHHKTHYTDGSDASRAGLLTMSHLTSSLKAGHNKKIPSRCPECKKTFVGLYELRRHYGRKHSEGEKGFGCRKCGKKFYIEVDVRDHEKLCGEPIECKCGLKFAFKCNLVAHKKAHPACQENHGTSSDDSDQSRGSSPRTGNASSQNAKQRSNHQYEVISPTSTQIPAVPEFTDFKLHQYNNSTGMHFPQPESPWPTAQYAGFQTPTHQNLTQFGGCNGFFLDSNSASSGQINPKQYNFGSMFDAFNAGGNGSGFSYSIPNMVHQYI